MKVEDLKWTTCRRGYGEHTMVDGIIAHRDSSDCCLHLVEGDGSTEEAEWLVNEINRVLRKVKHGPPRLNYAQRASHRYCELARPDDSLSDSTACALLYGNSELFDTLLEAIELEKGDI